MHYYLVHSNLAFIKYHVNVYLHWRLNVRRPFWDLDIKTFQCLTAFPSRMSIFLEIHYNVRICNVNMFRLYAPCGFGHALQYRNEPKTKQKQLKTVKV